ncbi:hypothetical protein K466DRAFT_607651 [Polyporus arcularius HHB13444]|uniref:Endonuclease/exonuclease/phosphatase domain-containing protein n=1 Tax=Polyporus arcularius HHB13444 TaxID=1314778 RepID=A0A5C3NWB9_9APHY|nr:hypothetical protein K466DRAFT_607651 [Polyporus arcularius HHB13444]
MLADGWRVTNPNKREYTFHRGTGPDAVFSRLDRIYVTPDIFDSAREWNICEAGVRTDHSLVLVQLTPTNAPLVGEGRPLFPLQLLRDKTLTRAIKECGLEAMRELADLAQRGVRTADLNPQLIFRKFKLEAMKLARIREKEVVPKLLAEIRDCERALKATKANRDLAEAEKIPELEALTKQTDQILVKIAQGMRS